MSIQEFVEKGGTYVFDPSLSNQSPDVLLANLGNYIDSICVVAKSEVGSTYFQSSTAPKDPNYGDMFTSFAQIASDIGIQVYALIHGNMDGFFSRDPNFQMHRSGGTIIPGYVCPSQEVYWQYLAEVAAEVTQRVDLEGIILKDIYYPREISCFCENCRRAFSVKHDIDRDYSLEQIKKRSNLYQKWQEDRIGSLRGLISTVVNRVHQEKKIEVLAEILLDPQTDYFEGATTQFGQDIDMISQITPHLLMHLNPWSQGPMGSEDVDQIKTVLEPYESKLSQGKNSLFVWDVNEDNFDAYLELKNNYSSSRLFFMDQAPRSILERRSLHLNLGV